MRYLAKYGRFGIDYRKIAVESYATGQTRTITDPIYIMFREGLMTPDERELALSTWTFEGSYQEQDEVTTVAPDYRIGVFDSEQAAADGNWSDELRIEIENFLIRYSERLEDVLVVPLVMVPPPWPRYDEYTGSTAALMRKLVDEGHDLVEVLAYERAVQNRPEVIAALQEEISEPQLVDRPMEEEIVG